jgi:hypothetical protein
MYRQVAIFSKGEFIMKLKWIIVGFVLGLVLSLSISSFAEGAKEYILYQADYPIYVHGERYTNNEKPILNYRGLTYVPLTAMAAMLGIDIEWDKTNKALNIENTEVLMNVDSGTAAKEYISQDVLPDGGEYITETVNGKECKLVMLNGIKYISKIDLYAALKVVYAGINTKSGISTYRKNGVDVFVNVCSDDYFSTSLGNGYYKFSLFEVFVEGE